MSPAVRRWRTDGRPREKEPGIGGRDFIWVLGESGWRGERDMRMRILTLATAGLAVALLAIPHHALATCVMTASPADATIPNVLGRTYYVVIIGCGSVRCPFAEYIYEEGNGVAGLQRADGWVDDTCGRPWLSDYEVF